MRAHHNYMAVTILRLTRREFYRMSPGLFYDMVQIHSARLGGGNAEID
nr:MAG TPA: hypothetical protein [Caudoviricetes sp.]